MKTADMPVLDLPGSGYERGCVYGETLRDKIRDFFEVYVEQAALMLPLSLTEMRQLSSDRLIDHFLGDTDTLSAVKDFAPDLLEEVRGIAEGAGLTFDQVFFMQLLDELWTYCVRAENGGAAEKCTTFGVTDCEGGVTYSGQNMDVGTWMEGYQVLLKIREPEGDRMAYVFSATGIIGLNGMNNTPFGVACNALVQLASSPKGLPVAFILRRLLQLDGMGDACAFLQDVQHASGQNYLLSAPDVIRSFECSANLVDEYVLAYDFTRSFHTNHPIVNKDLGSVVSSSASQASTHARLASVAGRLGANRSALSLNDIKSALGAHDDPSFPVSRLGDPEDKLIGYTVGSSIYELGPDPKLHIAAGPPCRNEYHSFSF